MLSAPLSLILLGLVTLSVQEERTKIVLDAPLAPVIFIPGDLGTPIYAKLDKISSCCNCPLKSDWFRLWVRIQEFLPSRIDCLIENLKLTFDPTTNTSHNMPGVETKVPGWGTSKSVEYVDDSFLARLLHVAADAAPLVKEMVKWGYRRDVSFRGAPYDFRFAMASNPEFFSRLKILVEETFDMNGNRKVAIMSHSLGGFYATWFFNQQTAEWKAKYIHSYISLSTPWGGSMKALLAVTSGYNMNIPTVAPLDTRKLQKTVESNYLLLPRHQFYKPGKIFVYTPTRNYTLSPKDMDSYFRDSQNPTGGRIYVETMKRNQYKGNTGLLPPHPGVKTYCLYGDGKPSYDTFHYDRNFPDANPNIQYGLGDGAALRASASGCKLWLKEAPDQPTEILEFPTASHSGIFSDQNALHAIRSILSKDE